MHDLCVVFDIDDTLYLESDYVASGFRTVGEWAAKWLALPDFGARCLELFELGRRRNIFNAALEASDREANPELVEGLVSLYRSHCPRIRLTDDAARAVADIRTEWPIAVISDGPVTSQSRKAEALGLAAFADPILLTGVLGPGFHKPRIPAFELVSRKIQARNYVYVADNPVKDFAAPNQLGWRSVRIRRPGGLHYAIDSGPELPGHELEDCSGLGVVLRQFAGRAE